MPKSAKTFALPCGAQISVLLIMARCNHFSFIDVCRRKFFFTFVCIFSSRWQNCTSHRRDIDDELTKILGASFYLCRFSRSDIHDTKKLPARNNETHHIFESGCTVRPIRSSLPRSTLIIMQRISLRAVPAEQENEAPETNSSCLRFFLLCRCKYMVTLFPVLCRFFCNYYVKHYWPRLGTPNATNKFLIPTPCCFARYTHLEQFLCCLVKFEK